MHCLGRTKKGHPKHPLYVAGIDRAGTRSEQGEGVPRVPKDPWNFRYQEDLPQDSSRPATSPQAASINLRAKGVPLRLKGRTEQSERSQGDSATSLDSNINQCNPKDEALE